ncbi:hypothetical protein [Clostridium frigidicarnis]|uniref:Uncharacterized protein n=1 Tax=Clostridium frigidicarnis TaxID=84698 RepID=A0A1I0V0R1_9CLOT|nr:hypothetical protein [Clostridium frigidicarnis]SFA69939.1 hypothetical protein SAMN04488528_100175 [Clostridium frigidicarnis]
MEKLNIKDRVANLLRVKSIIALLLTLTFCALTLWNGNITESFTNILLIVIGFYFGQSSKNISVKGE